MSPDIWLAFALASLVVLVIPGPTILLVCTYALSAGRSVGAWMVLGVGLGDLVAMSAAMLGLGALMTSSAELFTLLRWIGAAYLIYLGIKLWRAPTELDAAQAPAKPSSGPMMAAHAFAVTVANPKSILFFVAFVPQFLDHAAPFWPQVSVMVATFTLLGMLNAFAYVLLAAKARQRLRSPGALRWVNRVGGSALIAMGALAAATRRASA
ncbi:MAG: LysE family translocator [Neomegalonema sp.]|nr:LysE family translocator [Neomegalonema sp.]